MYTNYFALRESPFTIAPNPDFLYLTERHREALAHLTYGLQESGGFVLLTGEVGTGKTTVARHLLQKLPERCDVALILNPSLTQEELLATLCDELHISYPPQPTLKQLTDAIQDKLLTNLNAGRNTLLIVDEAQHLRPDVLEQLRLLTNLETNTRKLLKVVLIGQPELQHLLQRRELRQLAQRITARYHLQPLTRDEVARYVQHRLNVAGCERPLFTRPAIRRLHQLSGGIPRVINLICDRALLGAFSSGKELVDHRLIGQAGQEVLGVVPQRQPQVSPLRVAGISAMVASALLLSLSLGWAWRTVSAGSTQAEPNPTALASTLPSAQVDTVPVDPALLQLIDQSRQLEPALAALFALWESTLPDPDAVTACEKALNQRLGCLWQSGDWASMLALGRPAVVRLHGGGQGSFYATVVTADSDRIQLLLAGREVEVSQAWLEQHWQGSYVLLWQTPPGYNGPIGWSAQGDSVQWLENGLSLWLGARPRVVREFDSALERQVRAFQLSQALQVDGVAGANTLIRLNQALELNGPRLMHTAKES